MIIKNIEKDLLVVDIKSGTYPFQLNICLYFADGLLIDTGASNILKKIIPFLKNEKVYFAALTHIHEDHSGASAWIKDNLKIPVYLHKNSINEASLKSDIPLYRRIVWGNREAFKADPIPEFIETENCRFDVIYSPGHHKNHVVFHEKNRGWLFTGDLFVSRRQVVAFKDENIHDAIESITKILRLDFDKIFCGHSGVHIDGREKLKSKLDFYLELQWKVKSFKEHGLSYIEIDKRLFPKKGLWYFVSRGEWSSINLVKTVL